MMNVLEHQHPLTLIDLNVNDEDVEESDEEEEDEEKDLITQNEFVCTCMRCDQKINEYYRYFYKCIDDSCDYSLHKFCAEVPTTLKHTSHSHPLTLTHHPFYKFYPQIEHKAYEVRYECSNSCSYYVDVSCVVEVDKKRIHHPSHPHPLVSLISKPILCECNACGREHKGIFFLCTTCPNFAIHTLCAFLPKSLLIQHSSNDTFHHTHPLTLSYSFPIAEQKAKYSPKCRVCHGNFSLENIWIYKCEKCIYYSHLICATSTSRINPFMPFWYRGIDNTVKNFKDADYHDLLHLPFPDQTYSLPKHLLFGEIGPTTYGIDKVSLEHIHHQHELILVDKQCGDTLGPTSNINLLLMCHNPMKKVELVCNGCLRPIMEIPFYMCGANEDEGCNFALHEWCTRLPTKVDNHPGHPQHTLVLMSKVPYVFFNIFYCAVCHLPCNGYAFGCVKCKFYIDVTCGFIPEKITHESHENHLLRVSKIPPFERCHMCLEPISNEMLDLHSSPTQLGFSCRTCDGCILHVECALLLPKSIRHAYDKHPMYLSYLPIENHNSEYFCEICECELNPHSCFYHCNECAQSVHSACAPLLLCCEIETYSYYRDNLYRFINVKFGSIHKTDDHPHPLSFSQGILSDVKCSTCGERLQYNMILKCVECQFAIHALKTQCRSVLSLLPPIN